MFEVETDGRWLNGQAGITGCEVVFYGAPVKDRDRAVRKQQHMEYEVGNHARVVEVPDDRSFADEAAKAGS